MKEFLVLFTLIFLLTSVTATIEINGNENDRVINLGIIDKIKTFLHLTDTPLTYSGQGTNCVIVNAGETALEFGSCGGGGGAGDKWIDGGTYIYPNSTFADNIRIFGYIQAIDWTNVSITESQISDLVHTENASWNQSLASDLFLEDNANIDLGNYNGTFDWIFAKLNWSWLQNIPSYVKDWSFKLNATDQRYNETDLALSINTTGNIESLGFTQGAHTIDTNASSICSNTEVLLGNGSCYNSTLFFDDTDTNTQKTTNGFYLYNDSITIFFNETQLNSTIDSRAGGGMNYTNLALTNESETWDAGLNISMGNDGWFKGNLNWSWVQNAPTSTWLSTYNITYHGLINNASYLSTYNATYDSHVQDNESWNQSYADITYLKLDTSNDPITGDLTLNQKLLFGSQIFPLRIFAPSIIQMNIESQPGTIYLNATTIRLGASTVKVGDGTETSPDLIFDGSASDGAIIWSSPTSLFSFPAHILISSGRKLILSSTSSAAFAINLSSPRNYELMIEAKKVNMTGLDDLYIDGNFSLADKITFAFGEIIDNLVDGWLRITGNLNVTGTITADIVKANCIEEEYDIEFSDNGGLPDSGYLTLEGAINHGVGYGRYITQNSTVTGMIVGSETATSCTKDIVLQLREVALAVPNGWKHVVNVTGELDAFYSIKNTTMNYDINESRQLAVYSYDWTCSGVADDVVVYVTLKRRCD